MDERERGYRAGIEAAARWIEGAGAFTKKDRDALAAGIRTLPVAEALDDEALVERCALAMQRENRPKHDCRNRDQREAEESETLPAYKALARAALREVRALR